MRTRADQIGHAAPACSSVIVLRQELRDPKVDTDIQWTVILPRLYSLHYDLMRVVCSHMVVGVTTLQHPAADRLMRNRPLRKSKFFYGYVVVIASFAVIAVASGALYSFSVFVEPLQQHFGWSRAVTAGAFSVSMVGQGTFSIGSGKLTDRFGPRLVVSVSGLLFGLGFLMMSRVDTVWQFYIVYGLMIAAGFSGVPVPLMSTIARWFHTRRGLMTGIVMAGSGVGTMLMPPLANWLIYHTDWRTAYMALGLILTAVIVLSAQFLRRDPSEERFRLSKLDELTGERTAQTFPRAGLQLSAVMRTKQFWLLCIAFLGFGYAFQSVMVHVVVHARGLGFSPASAAAIMSVVGGFGIVGRIGVGGLADRLGARWLLTIVFAMLSLSLFWLVIADQRWAIYTLAAVFGFAYGGVVPLESYRAAELFGLRAHGTILGAIVFSVLIGSAGGPALAGYGFDFLGSYTIPFAVCGVVAALAGFLTLFVKPLPSGSPQQVSTGTQIAEE